MNERTFTVLDIIINKTNIKARKIIQESRAIARKPRDVAAVVFGLNFIDNIHDTFKSSELRKPGFIAPNIPAQNII